MATGLFVLGTTSSHASMMLTADGVNLGFSLSTFVSGFPNSGVGPLGIGINNLGQVIVDSGQDRRNYVFNDVDNQTLGNAISSTPFSGWPAAFATVNGTVWGSMGWSAGGALVKFNADGSVAASFSNITINNGMWTNPANNHLIAAGASGLLDIDVSSATPSARIINNASSDGVTVSPDGKFVYTSGGLVFDIATGVQQPGNFNVSGADGMGILSSLDLNLNGDIIVNTTGGSVVLVDHLTFAQTVIASGGSRGDYTSPDFTNGTLFLTQSESVLRLSCGKNCAIGSTPPPTNGVPEPGVLGLLGIGVVSLAAATRRRRTANS